MHSPPQSPVFSRYVANWMLVSREFAALAKTLISETFFKQDVILGKPVSHYN